MRSKIALISLVMTVAAVVAACGGADPTPTATAVPQAPTPTPTPIPTPTPTATPAPTPTPTLPGPNVSLAPLQDNSIYESSRALSNGVGSFLFTGNNAGGLARRTLVLFDVQSSVPSGSTITNVTLRMMMSRTGTTADKTATVHRVLASWGEAGSKALGNEGRGEAAETGDATWTHRSHESEAWDSEGGDFVEPPSASLAMGRVGAYTIGSTEGMIVDVQAWLDDPSSNFGWLLKGDESSAKTAKRFDSRENPKEENRPILTIHYAPPG